MTRTELRNYLQEIHSQDKEIRRLQHRITILRESLEQTTPAYREDVVSHTGNKHAMEDKIIERLDLEHTLEDMIATQKKRKLQAAQAFARLSNPELEDVMIRRYICGKSWADIACETDRSYCTVRRRDREALDELLTFDEFKK